MTERNTMRMQTDVKKELLYYHHRGIYDVFSDFRVHRLFG